MTKLTTLRSQLAGLRRARSAVRGATAYSALAIALVWSLAAVFAIDVLFELDLLPRMVVLCLAAAAVGWAAYRYTRPLLGASETEEDMALLVERQQNIDSDLIAALQFESPSAAAWGSPQLEGAVIDYVANVGGGINVFDGFSRKTLQRRGTLLGISAAIVLIAAAIFPGHAWAFFNRLLLGRMHYPTDTLIDQIVVNGQPILLRGQHGSQPLDVKCAEGRPISFLVECSGELPTSGLAAFASRAAPASKTKVELRPLSLADRFARLKLAHQKLAEAAGNPEIDVSRPWQVEVAALLRFDAPAVAAALCELKVRADLEQIVRETQRVTAAWPGDAEQRAIYSGELARLLDDVEYGLVVGDAWTDSASIEMIPLPIVEPRLIAQPPAYARSALGPIDPASRQLSVVEGSAVEVGVECTNGKRLTAAWMLLKNATDVERLELKAQDAEGLRWALPRGHAQLDRVTAELRYEMQVLDADGLSLETPLRGIIRIKPDRPPFGSADVVHKVVLPTAAPVIEYRASDDFALSQARLLLSVERNSEGDVEATPPSDGSETAMAPGELAESETVAVSLLAPGTQIPAAQLPLLRQHVLQLAPLGLAKGDRVKITLETTDCRGEDSEGKPLGKSHQSEPLVLEISDESGVLAAISAADERSEQRLTEIIKRQLGIGEAP